MAATLSHTPDLQLREATLEDIPAIRETWYTVFPDPFMRKIFPDTPAVNKWWDEANSYDLTHRPEAKYLVVKDESKEGKGKVAGYAKWFVPVGDRRLEIEERFPAWHEDSDRELADAFFGSLGASRKKLMGDKQYYFLCALGTIPEYRRQGVADKLVSWATEKADRDGLAAFIDASDAGRVVYEKHGFVAVESVGVPGQGFNVTSYVRPENFKR